MSRRHIIFDMDSILADFYFGVLDAYEAETGVRLPPESIAKWGFTFPNGKDILAYFSKPGFFRDLKPIPGSLELFTKCHARGDELTIVTAATLTNAPGEKYEWLEHHLPWFNRDDICFFKRKHKVTGADFFIDDHASNTSAYKKANPMTTVIGIEYPYNATEPGAFDHLVPSYLDFGGAYRKIDEILFPEDFKICSCGCNDYATDCCGGRQ